MPVRCTTETTSCLRDEDREFFERELNSFLPDRIFDAHTHLYDRQDVTWSFPQVPADIGYEQYMRLIADIHPNRKTAALFIPGICTDRRDRVAHSNQWVSQHTRANPQCRGEFFVTPTDDPQWVRQELKRLGLHGFKCYHTFSSVTPTWQAEIPDYLPEPLIKVAHEEGWVITLHMVKARAAADPKNIYWIRHYCTQYPNMKLILAHSARAFQPAHNLQGLTQLTGLDNLYFDTSANCEPLAHQAIMRIIGHKKLLYGSDLPVSHLRGRSVAAADSFLWLYEDTPVWDQTYQKIAPVLIGLEHLRSLKWACWSERLSDSQVEDIFWNNAANLLCIKSAGLLAVLRHRVLINYAAAGENISAADIITSVLESVPEPSDA